MLGIESGGLDRRDAEELVVEKVGVVDEVGEPGVHGARPELIAMDALDIPAFAGNDACGDVAVHQQLPKRVGGGGAGQPAVDANDGDVGHRQIPRSGDRCPAMSSIVG